MFSSGFGNGMESATVNMKERRQYQRSEAQFTVEVRIARYRETFTVRNSSGGGLFLEAIDKPKPPLRTIVRITAEGKGTVLGRVVWVTDDGMGIEFIDKPLDC